MARSRDRSPLVAVDGIEYPSLERAAKALRLPPHILSLRLSCPDFPNYQRKWVSNEVEYDHLSGRPASRQNTPIMVDGVNYPSIKAAAEKLDIKYEVVRYRLKSPNYPTYHRKDEVKLPKPLQSPNNQCLVPVIVDGVEYPSMREAERALGLPPNVIYNRVKSPSHPNYHRKGEAKEPARRKSGTSKAVIVDGVEYFSLNHAATVLRIASTRIRDRADSPRFPNYQWKKDSRYER